jgi:hypothetical protein
MLGVMFTLGITATSASALVLPDVHALAESEYPLHMQFNDNGKTPSKIIDVAGNILEGKGLFLLFLLKNLSALGEFEVAYLNVVKVNKTGNISCNTVGDKKGEILVKGEFHIVPINTNHEDGILGLFKEFTVECGAARIKIKGAIVATINYKGMGETSDFTELCGELKGNGAGKNNLTEYLNDSGSKVKAILESEFGNGFKQMALEVGEEVCQAALNKGMGSVLQR